MKAKEAVLHVRQRLSGRIDVLRRRAGNRRRIYPAYCVFRPSRSPVPEQADHGFLGSRSLNEALTCR